MNLVTKLGVFCIFTLAFVTSAFADEVSGPISSAISSGKVERPHKKASDIFGSAGKPYDPKDYEINWLEVLPSENQAFMPEMKCDISKRYFEVASRNGFKVPPSTKDSFPGSLDNIKDDYDQKGVMPWPGILAHWQDWGSGLYIEIQRVKEHDMAGNLNDYMVVRLHSMCTDELLTESATIIQNPHLTQTLKLPTISYGMKLNVGQIYLKVNRFEANPQSDEIELELHHVESFTKDAKRTKMKLYRFM